MGNLREQPVSGQFWLSPTQVFLLCITQFVTKLNTDRLRGILSFSLIVCQLLQNSKPLLGAKLSGNAAKYFRCTVWAFKQEINFQKVQNYKHCFRYNKKIFPSLICFKKITLYWWRHLQLKKIQSTKVKPKNIKLFWWSTFFLYSKEIDKCQEDSFSVKAIKSWTICLYNQ